MASREILLTVEYHTDDDTGIYQIGEIDFGISETLADYLKYYGYKGKEEIVKTLTLLIDEVELHFKDIQ